MTAMLSFILECGSSRDGSNARWALRIRVSMSEIGSVISIVFLVLVSRRLPTRLRHTRNQPGQRRLAKGQARAAELPQIRVPAAAHRAAIDHAGPARVC